MFSYNPLTLEFIVFLSVVVFICCNFVLDFILNKNGVLVLESEVSDSLFGLLMKVPVMVPV